MKALEHFRDNLIVYIPFFLLYSLAGYLTKNSYLKMGLVFGGLLIILVLILVLKEYLNKRNIRKQIDSKWKFLSELSLDEQTAILDLFKVAKIRGLYNGVSLEKEIENYFLESNKVKIKVTRGFNIFVDDGTTSKKDIFHHCLTDIGRNQERDIEVLLHFPCLKNEHTIKRSEANRISPEYYIESLFIVLKEIKEITNSRNNKNDISVKFYDDYEIKWRYYLFSNSKNNQKTLFLNYYDDSKSGADSAMLKIDFGAGTLCQDFDRKFDEIFRNDKYSKEIITNLKNKKTLITKRLCEHKECETKTIEFYNKYFN